MSTTPIEHTETWTWQVEPPDISDIVIEDDEPMDNIYSEKQQRLLNDVLYASWEGPRDADGAPMPFFAAANVGVFISIHQQPLVPDVLVAADVAVHPDATHDKRRRTYFIWEMGKPPDVVIEVVSNRKGGELTRRKAGYVRMGVPYFVVWDPERILGERELMAWVSSGGAYVPLTTLTFAPLGGLSLRPWEGTYEGLHARWLRWYDGEVLIPTGRERAEAERARAEAERARADRLAAVLAKHGIELDEG